MNLFVLNPGVIVYDFNTDSELKDQIFPDFYSDGPSIQDLQAAQSYFDYASLMVYTHNKQYSLASFKNSAEMCEALRSEVACLAPADRDIYILRNTSLVHELRHFHDVVCTNTGLARFDLIFSDLIQFLLAVLELKIEARRQGGRTALPDVLKKPDPKTSTTGNDPIGAYQASHTINKESMAFLDGSLFVPRESPNTKRLYTVIGFPVSNLMPGLGPMKTYKRRMMTDYGVPPFAWDAVAKSKEKLVFLPAAPLNLRKGEVDNVGLGYRIATESAAWVCQYCLINYIWGQKVADHIKLKLERVRQPFKHPYMVLDLFISKHFKPFQLSLCTALSDYSLNPEANTEFLSLHPGWRITEWLRNSKASTMSSSAPSNPQSTGAQLAAFRNCISHLNSRATEIEEMAARLNWPILGSVARFARYITSLASLAADARNELPSIMADPDQYLLYSSDRLPFPPSIALLDEDGESGELRTILFTHNHITNDHDILMWFFVSHLAGDFAKGRNISCPVKRWNLQCANKSSYCDLLLHEGNWHKDCMFFNFLAQLGIGIDRTEAQ